MHSDRATRRMDAIGKRFVQEVVWTKFPIRISYLKQSSEGGPLVNANEDIISLRANRKNTAR
jgi:hypothetical protein